MIHQNVAPLVGAWIEINAVVCITTGKEVAPLVGAWIEIVESATNSIKEESRSSCRSVD